MSQTALSKSPRQAFFAGFSSRALQVLDSFPDGSAPRILLTGGLRTPSHLQTALTSHHADLLGVGRGSVTTPDLPDILRRWEQDNGDTIDKTYTPFGPEAPDLFDAYPAPVNWILSFANNVKLVGAGSGMAWHVVMLRRIARTPQDRAVFMDYTLGAVGSIICMWVDDEWLSFARIASGCILLLMMGTIIHHKQN